MSGWSFSRVALSALMLLPLALPAENTLNTVQDPVSYTHLTLPTIYSV